MSALTDTIAPVQVASMLCAALVAVVVAFQVGLALGAPYGEAVFGGKAPNREGVLSAGFRLLASVQAAVLVLIGWVLLARAGVVPIPLGSGAVVWTTWAVVVFLAVNTAANFAAPHPIERWVMGSVTLLLCGLGLFIALRAPVVL